MSYQSRLFQSKWTYEPFDTTADDFNSKVGRVLNRGAYTGQLHKSSTYASSIAQQQADIATTQPLSGSTAELNSFIPAAATVCAVQEPCQYTWVDGTGKPVDSTLAACNLGQQAKPGVQSNTGVKSKPYNQEVMDLWKRINPGVMEGYVDMPGSTMADHFKWLDPAQQESLNRTHHLKKTDFSEYNEVAARSMKALITNKISP